MTEAAWCFPRSPITPTCRSCTSEPRFFDGVLEEDGTINGEWLCAPLDVEQGGINDDSIFAEGTWTTTEILTARR
jgi:hypothetical protein